MGFFKSIKKKLSIFKKQLRKVLPNEIMDNPEIVAAFIIGGSIPFGVDEKSLFARGATSMSAMYTNSKEYFTDLNDKLGFGKEYVPSKVIGVSGDIVVKSKPGMQATGFLGKSIEGIEGFLGEHPKIKKGTGKFLEKYLEKQISGGEKVGAIETGATRGTRGTYRRGTGAPHTGFKSASAQIKPGYRNRYVQSSVYNILSNPNYKAIWSGGINSGDMISTTFTRAAGPVTKLESSRLGG
jgi:hypothetical protein